MSKTPRRTFCMVTKLLKTIPYVWEANCFLLQMKTQILYASHITRVQPLSQTFKLFYVLLTVHPGMILVNNQLDAQFFVYVYLYSLYVSGSHVPIIRYAGAYAPAYHTVMYTE